jgi:hypothetical protein
MTLNLYNLHPRIRWKEKTEIGGIEMKPRNIYIITSSDPSKSSILFIKIKTVI